MDKKIQDLAWTCLPKEVREEIKKDYKSHPSAYHPYFNEGYGEALKIYFGKHNLTSDTEPSEFICVERVKVDALQSEIFKEIMDAHDAEDWQSVAHYVLDVLPRSFHAIFGDKCLPDNPNTPNSGELKLQEVDNETDKELEHRLEQSSIQIEPKFKVGDKVIVKANAIDPSNHIGEIALMYEYDPDMYEVRITPCCSYILHITDLEPYTEAISQNPAENCDSGSLNSKSENMEEKELNLIELLKGYEGMEIYSLLEGITYILKVDDSLIETSVEKYGEKGEVYVNDVCLLYPSRSLYEKYPFDAYSAWMEWKKAREPKRWRAEKYRQYYCIGFEIEVCPAIEHFTEVDNNRHRCGNYFRTKEEAQQASEIVKEALLKFQEKK